MQHKVKQSNPEKPNPDMQHARHTCERIFFTNTDAHRLVVACPTYHLPLTSYRVQNRKRLVTRIFRNVILLGQKQGESKPLGACGPFTPENQFCFFYLHSHAATRTNPGKPALAGSTSLKAAVWTGISPEASLSTPVYYNWYGTVRVPTVRTYTRKMVGRWPI